ncbi:MAG: sigma-70 family RNA polymerase sigma factor [Anaerolineales bacterium]|nr:sigma-70 family RNA polymerase sigma factor [Anaerolineales bacterium]
MTEAELIAALQQQEAAAFQHLFDRYADKIYRLALGLLHDEVEAEGVVQDSFMRVIERIDQFEGRAQIGTWIYRIAHNLSQDRLRRRQRLGHLNEDLSADGDITPQILVDWSHSPEEALSEHELTDAIIQAVNTLSLNLRAVFILRDIDGLSTEETAAALELSPSAVKVRLHRARLQIREILSAQFEPLLRN